MKYPLQIIIIISCFLCSCISRIEYIDILKKDDYAYIMVVPKDDPRFTKGAKIMQLVGTGCAWSREEGLIELNNIEDDIGFDLIEELRTKNLGVGFSEKTTNSIIKQAKENGISDTFVSTLAMFPIDHDARIVANNVNFNRFRIMKMKEFKSSINNEVSFMLIEMEIRPLKNLK